MNDLLKVLDMDEDFQWNFLIARQDIQEMCQNQLDAWCESKYKRRILADLAFRLRDEVCKAIGGCEKYNAALEAIYDYRGIKKQCQSFYAFLTYRLQPIDMIIASLKAKEKEDD